MAKYETLAEHYIDDELIPAGRQIEYPGWPGTKLKPLDKEAEKNAARWEELKAKKKADPKFALPRSPKEDVEAPKAEAEKKSGGKAEK